MKTLFWLLFSIITYHYFLFPLLTLLLAQIRRLQVNKAACTAKVSLIIAAYNEEKCIREKIENSFALDYPENKLEIIIVSDGSTDATPAIAESYQAQGVISLFAAPRKGKTAALNRAVSVANGEFIVFSDANSMYRPDAVSQLVANFADPTVGGVCGRKSIVRNDSRESSEGDSLFWHIESFLKIQQSRAGSITTGDGEIFSIRKKLYTTIPEEIINDDTAITFQIIEQGYRVVYEPKAVSAEEASIILEDDFNVKIRMVSGGYQTLQYFGKVICPPTSFFAVQFISHKVLRWTMPFWLAALLLVNSGLSGSFYVTFLCLQLAFYLLAVAGFIRKKTGGKVPALLYIPLYYCTMNLAALKGLLSFLKNESQINVWKKAAR